MIRACAVALLALGMTLGTVAQAEVYRWVDKNGKVQYSDVPPNDVNAQPRKLGENTIEVDKLPYEVRKAAEAAPITFYSSPDYKEASDAARNLLKARKLPFTEKPVKTTEDAKELVKQLGKAPMVPALAVGSKVVEGFSESNWNNAIDAAGYPKPVKLKGAEKE
ncbi:MAG: hypothetical protein RJA63_785 [Pseudomonadota bacterium]|jgi:hypothetical protein